jgi:hypothetical protein
MNTALFKNENFRPYFRGFAVPLKHSPSTKNAIRSQYRHFQKKIPEFSTVLGHA